jgi:putative ABC transport system ATP-binding protein
MSAGSQPTQEDSGVSADGKLAYSIRGLKKIYRMGEAEVQALRGVDLDIREREMIVLLGPSGSGKSTLLNILGGLDRPTSGSVRFRDQDLTALDDRQLTRFRRQHVGFIFQFYNLMPSLTARENVELVTEIAPDPMAAADALQLVGMGERMDHFPAQLSGGEQQRIAVARAVAKRPEVLLCDEPTGALDSATGILVLEALAKVNKELGTTTALITHNVAIGQMADRIVRFADGMVVNVETNPRRRPASELQW